MSDFIIEPSLTKIATGQAFVQTIRIENNGVTVAKAIWHSTGNAEGVAQLIDLEVAPEHRRHKHGTRLMHEAVRQMKLYFARLQIPQRRIWVGVEQKSQVIARAFLMMHGFHHMNTVDTLFDKQDLLIYVRTLD